MGNVFTIVQPTMLESVPPPNLPKQPSSANYDPAKETLQISSDLNPGTVQDLHKKCEDVFPSVFEGVELILGHELGNHFQIGHSIKRSTEAPSGYSFMTTYVGTNQFGPMEKYPVLAVAVDPSGTMTAKMIHKYKNIHGIYFTQVQGNSFASQAALDYKGSDYTASLSRLYVQNNSVLVGLDYLKNVTPSLALGADMLYEYGPEVPEGQMPAMAFDGRYTGSNYIISGTLGPYGLHACYYRKDGENIQVGVDLKTNFRSSESVCSIGYQIDLPKANLVFRGMADSNWNVGAVLEKELKPFPFTLALSGMLNHSWRDYKFGIRLTIG